ncbi:MAG: peptidoglycan-binding domain-containing protein [Gammaproteobacteria bacterium]
MRKRSKCLCCILALGIATSAAAADIQSIAECARQQRQAQMAGVQNYAIVMEMMGHTVPQYFERAQLTGPTGASYEGFVLVPPDEIARRQDQQGMTPEALDAYADGLRMTGDALETEALKSGLPVDMIFSRGPAPGEEPWASPNPSVMMGSMADFAEFAADAKRRRSEGVPASNDAEKIFANAELVGTDDVNGRSAWHLRSDNLDITETTNGQQFTINSVDYWMDRDDCVPLKFHMKGKATGDGGTPRDIFIEKTESDYRQVPATNMLMSYTQTMRMGGVLTPAEEKQMAEARQQMAELEKQMAAMPASQRSMMESMMGSQMEAMRKMVDSGAFEMEMRVKEVRVNEGTDGLAALTSPFGIPMGGAAAGADPDLGLVGMIQRDLKALGFYDGDVNGELTKMTVVAISRYQAENGMEVTGEATPQLAGMLSAAVDAQN